jgi:glycosyltransferase involved in cell wall biosynthesis
MPCLQQRAFVEEAVRSVLDQQVDVELLVLDPGSTDGSREVVEALRRTYGERLVPCFETDRGQSDAINRGMARARGEVLGWLNSDDRLRPGALSVVVDAFGGAAEPRWLYGRAGMIDAGGAPVLSWIARYKSRRGRRFSRFKLLTENFIPQMAVFWNRAMWQRAGGLDVARHLDMDYDLWFRFARCADPVVLDAELAEFRVHEGAKGSRRTTEQLDAALETARRYAGDVAGGAVALCLHRIYAARTRLLYRWVKPR